MDRKNEGELTRTEAAEYLGYTYKGFTGVVRLIRHTRRFDRLYFTTEALDEFHDSRTVEHVPDPPRT